MIYYLKRENINLIGKKPFKYFLNQINQTSNNTHKTRKHDVFPNKMQFEESNVTYYSYSNYITSV